MDPESSAQALRRDGALLLDAAAANLDAPVASCPGWVVADVVGHLGRVYRSVADIVERQSTELPTARVPKPPSGPAVLEFFREGHAALVDVLARTPSDAPAYTWSSDHTAGFYHRRMAHETAVHRADVELAAGRSITAFDGDTAADGIDELYDVVMPFGLSRVAADLPAGSLHLHRTDGDGEWTLQIVDGELQLGRLHGKSTAAVRGPASDLFVFAWHRGRADTLEVFGDASVADAWAALAP